MLNLSVYGKSSGKRNNACIYRCHFGKYVKICVSIEMHNERHIQFCLWVRIYLINVKHFGWSSFGILAYLYFHCSSHMQMRVPFRQIEWNDDGDDGVVNIFEQQNWSHPTDALMHFTMCVPVFSFCYSPINKLRMLCDIFFFRSSDGIFSSLVQLHFLFSCEEF